MRLARKLMLALVLAMFAIFTGRAVLRVRYETRVFDADLREHQRLVLLALKAPLQRLLRDAGPAALEASLREAEAQLRPAHLRWVSFEPGDGATVQRPAEVPDRATLARGEPVVMEDRSSRHLVTYLALGNGGPALGAIEISDSLTNPRPALRDRVLEALANTAAAALGAMIVVSGLGFVLVGRPLRSLAEKARRIGAGDLSGPLVIRQRDEIGQLAAEMNQMCDRLAAAHRRADAESAARLETLDQLRHAERLSTVGKLASGIGHELGTPLNVVSGRAKMIASGEVSGGEALDSARTIAEQAERMASIIRQLLDFARRRGPQKAPGGLKEIARNAGALLLPFARKHKVALALPDGAEPEITASVDAGQLQQVLTNLMVNGIQAMPDGGTLRVEVERETALPPPDCGGAEGVHCAIRVIDHGAGILPEHIAHLFEPFFTTKGVGEGTGLGLSVAYGIVKEHGGWIAIDSTPGKGSRFSVYLPGEEGRA
jgi:two-component system NtrC family sensor kinase